MPATQSQTIPWYCERYPVTVSNSRYMMCIWNIVSSFLFIGTTNSISELGPIRHRRREVIPLPSRMTPNPRLLSFGLGYVTHYIGWHSESLKSVPITVISWGIGLFIHFIFFLFEQKKTIKGYARMRYSVIWHRYLSGVTARLTIS